LISSRYDREPAHKLTAERLFERQWALTALGRVLERLEADMAPNAITMDFSFNFPPRLTHSEPEGIGETPRPSASELPISEFHHNSTKGRNHEKDRRVVNLRDVVGGNLVSDPSSDYERSGLDLWRRSALLVWAVSCFRTLVFS